MLQAAEIFGPGRLTVSLSVDEDLPACNWVERLAPPDGYTMQGSMVQRFNCGGCVVHYNLMRSDNTSGPGALPSSPSTVLDTVLFGSLAGKEIHPSTAFLAHETHVNRTLSMHESCIGGKFLSLPVSLLQFVLAQLEEIHPHMDAAYKAWVPRISATRAYCTCKMLLQANFSRLCS